MRLILFLPPSSLPTYQFGWTAMIYAARYGHAEVVELLISQQAQVDEVDTVCVREGLCVLLFSFVC
jgi:hypothetical protein